MKKMFVALLTAILLVVCAGCGNRPVIDTVWLFDEAMCGNRPVIDTVWLFDEAIVRMPDGTVISGKVESWRDFDDSDMLQVKIDGKVYLTHSANVVLWTEK